MNAKVGEKIRIQLINIDPSEVHTMHLHGMNFQVVAKDGNPVAQPESMNTVLIGPGETMDLAVEAENPGKWMFHCHILDHVMNGEDMSPGAMGGFVTILNIAP
jgi:FtsP/CotA-like multicopper oxidase with cupredoxin domain